MSAAKRISNVQHFLLLLLTSSSAVAERPRNACVESVIFRGGGGHFEAKC